MQPIAKGIQRHNPWVVFSVLAVAQFLVVMDASIVYIALPSIQRELGFSLTNLAWVMDAYILAFGGIMMLGGRAADLFGRRRVLVLGLIWFGIASLACGISTEAWHIVAARTAQGLGAAFVAPATLALVTDTFPEGPSRFKALGIFGGIGGIGGAAGTLLGGLLTTIAWQLAFLINIPIVVAILVIGTRLISANPPTAVGSVDLAGIVTSTGGMSLLLLALLRGGVQGWTSTTVVLEFVGAVVLLVAFALREATAQAPVIPRVLLRMRSVMLGNAANIIVGALLFGVFLVLTLFLQLVRSYTPLEAALWTLPISASLFLGSNLIHRLFGRVSPMDALTAALGIQAVGLAWWAVSLGTSGHIVTSFVLPAMVWSFGCGAALVAAFVVCTSGVLGPRMGAASGLVSTTLQVGGALGVGVLTIVSHRESDSMHRIQTLATGQAAALWGAVVIAAIGVMLMLWLRGFGPAPAPEQPDAE